MNLFTYGTLMDPAVWARVARENCVTRHATLAGYEARALSGVTFPGLIEAPGAITEGLLYLNVSREAIDRLDAYEDNFYMRVPVPVLLDDGTALEAEVYVMMPDQRAIVLPERWQSPR